MKTNVKKDNTCTFEVSDTVSQLPPVRENFPDPILRRISSGVSFGPLANGVYLKQGKGKKSRHSYKKKKKKTHVEICIGSLSWTSVTLLAWYTVELLNSRCHRLHHNLAALVPGDTQRKLILSDTESIDKCNILWFKSLISPPFSPLVPQSWQCNRGWGASRFLHEAAWQIQSRISW